MCVFEWRLNLHVLMTNDIEHLFKCLLAIWISSLWSVCWVFCTFIIFELSVFVFWICKSSLYIVDMVDMNLLSDICLEHFPPSMWFAFPFSSIISIDKWKFLIWMKFKWSIVILSTLQEDTPAWALSALCSQASGCSALIYMCLSHPYCRSPPLWVFALFAWRRLPGWRLKLPGWRLSSTLGSFTKQRWFTHPYQVLPGFGYYSPTLTGDFDTSSSVLLSRECFSRSQLYRITI